MSSLPGAHETNPDPRELPESNIIIHKLACFATSLRQVLWRLRAVLGSLAKKEIRNREIFLSNREALTSPDLFSRVIRIDSIKTSH